MTGSRAPRLLHRRATLWLISLLTIALLTFANLPWQLEDYDQAKQAFVSWQTVTSAHLLYHETPSGKVATKPPLVGWVSAILYRLTGSWNVAWRLPSLAAALVLAWLLWRQATTLFSDIAGVIALAAFSLNLLTPRLATLVRTDMPLGLVTFLIAVLFFERIRAREPWQSKQRATLFLLLTASMLIKGPIVYAFVLPAMVLFAWWYWGDGIRRSITTGWWPWLLSLAIFLAWVAGGIKTVPGFYDEVVLREFAVRFGETFHRPQPLYFYFPHLLLRWAPWSVLLIGLLVLDFRKPGLPLGTAAATRRIRTTWFAKWEPEIFWLLAWSIGGLLVMSCIPSKRVDRIFPVLPPLCLLLAAMTTFYPIPKERMARSFAVTLVVAAIFASSDTLFKVVSGIRQRRDALVHCGKEFRSRAAQNRWRYAILKDDNEALVLYLGAPGFVRPREAVEQLNAGKLDALIASERRIQPLRSKLEEGGEIVQSDLCLAAKGKERYIMLQRRGPAELRP